MSEPRPITPEEVRWVLRLVGYRRVPVREEPGLGAPAVRHEGEYRRPYVVVGTGWLVHQRQAKVRATVRRLYPPEMPAWALADWMEEHGRDEEAAIMREGLTLAREEDSDG